MPRPAVVLIAIAGCGRIAFDPRGETCADLPPGSPSGTYELASGPVYCEMVTAGGGWTRVGHVDPTIACPDVWPRVQTPVVCRSSVPTGTAGASGVEFPSPFPYSEVMGRLLAYQFDSPDAFGPLVVEPLIDNRYVDGVSITYRDAGVRQHVWTYAAGWSNQKNDEPINRCPCEAGGMSPPIFVGNAFACASGHNDPLNRPMGVWYVDDPLFDGMTPPGGTPGCGDPGGQFVVSLGAPTESPVEARIMVDQGSPQEDVGIARLELFVR